MGDVDSINELRNIKSSKKYRKISPILLNENKKINRIASMRNLKKNHKFLLNNMNNNIKSTNKYIDFFNKCLSINEEENLIEDNKLISFEEYNQILDKNLRDYKMILNDEKVKSKKKKKNDSELENIDDNEKKEKENKDNIIKKKILLRNKSEPYYKISENYINYYKNPYESLNAINNNNEIFNEISKNSIVRQRFLYDNQVKNFENYSMKFKIKMPKIKVQDLTSKVHGEIPVINLINNKNYKKEKNSEEESFPKLQKTNGEIKLFSYFKYPPKIFPEGKEQFSLCSKDKNLYLSGGLSTYMKQMPIWSLNMETLEWSKLPSTNSTNCRFGHTSVYYQNKIYFYGGRVKVEKASMLVGLEIYSINENIFVSSNIKGGPSKRRNHIAELIGNLMLIHGGIGEDNEILDDC